MYVRVRVCVRISYQGMHIKVLRISGSSSNLVPENSYSTVDSRQCRKFLHMAVVLLYTVLLVIQLSSSFNIVQYGTKNYYGTKGRLAADTLQVAGSTQELQQTNLFD